MFLLSVSPVASASYLCPCLVSWCAVEAQRTSMAERYGSNVQCTFSIRQSADSMVIPFEQIAPVNFSSLIRCVAECRNGSAVYDRF